MFSQFSPQPGHLCLEIIRHLHKVTQLCDFKAWALSPLIKWVGASMTWWQERKPLIILNPYTNLRHSIWAQNIWRAFITIVFKEENEARGSRRCAKGPNGKAMAGSVACLCALWSLSSSTKQMDSLSRSNKSLGGTGVKMPTENVQGTELFPCPLPSARVDRGGNFCRVVIPPESAVSLLASVRGHCNKAFM